MLSFLFFGGVRYLQQCSPPFVVASVYRPGSLLLMKIRATEFFIVGHSGWHDKKVRGPTQGL